MQAPSDHLVRNFSYRKDELLQALGNADSYIELALITAALFLAWLVALLIRRRVAAHLKAHPLRRIDPEFITKPLLLLAPLLALLYLGAVIGPMAQEFSSTKGGWTEAAIELCVAYLFAKTVL